MDFFILPNCKQCNASLIQRQNEFACIACGLPHPEVKIPDGFEDVEHAAKEPVRSELKPFVDLTEALADQLAEPDPEPVAHKPAKQKRR